MAKMKDLIAYLERNFVPHEVIEHTPAFTAHSVATAVHVPDREIAKTLIARADDRFVMLVLPADHRIDDHAIRTVLGARHASLAHEEDLGQIFPDCELGAMPPFGNLYGMQVIVDASLAGDAEIVFNACTHTHAVRLRTADYMRLVRPFVASISHAPHAVEEP
jgi:Ala-tRNA(Pro) deacylase